LQNKNSELDFEQINSTNTRIEIISTTKSTSFTGKLQSMSVDQRRELKQTIASANMVDKNIIPKKTHLGMCTNIEQKENRRIPTIVVPIH
jgi:hypothetical protein